MSKYRAIIFDLDGTAVASNPEAMPSKKLIEEVAAKKRGIHLIAATGRPPMYALPVINALGLTDPCIISGGTTIIDPSSGEFISRVTLPRKSVEGILKIVSKYSYDCLLGDPSGLHKHNSIDDDKLANIDCVFVFSSTGITKDTALKMTHLLHKIPDLAASLVPDWSGHGFALNITHNLATKEHAIGIVLDSLGVSKEHAIGIGDGHNDIHLFSAVGYRIAMDNADEDLKALADEVAPRQDEDGLAKMIELYG